MHVPDHIVKQLWKNHPDQIEEMEFPDGYDEAISLYAGLGLFGWVRPSGQIFIYNDMYSDELRVAEVFEAYELLIIAINEYGYDELREALPTKPASAASCSQCKSTGFIDGTICWTCHGLGWLSDVNTTDL